MATLFTSPRRFTLVRYETGHGPLLFRSGKTLDHPTRIDVLFLDVRAMEVRVWSDGFTVSDEPHEYLQCFSSRPAELVEPGLVTYRVSGNDWNGYVLAGVLRTAEDDAAFFARSPFDAFEVER
jgi:hypothetical protein